MFSDDLLRGRLRDAFRKWAGLRRSERAEGSSGNNGEEQGARVERIHAAIMTSRGSRSLLK